MLNRGTRDDLNGPAGPRRWTRAGTVRPSSPAAPAAAARRWQSPNPTVRVGKYGKYAPRGASAPRPTRLGCSGPARSLPSPLAGPPEPGPRVRGRRRRLGEAAGGRTRREARGPAFGSGDGPSLRVTGRGPATQATRPNLDWRRRRRRRSRGSLNFFRQRTEFHRKASTTARGTRRLGRRGGPRAPPPKSLQPVYAARSLQCPLRGVWAAGRSRRRRRGSGSVCRATPAPARRGPGVLRCEHGRRRLRPGPGGPAGGTP